MKTRMLYEGRTWINEIQESVRIYLLRCCKDNHFKVLDRLEELHKIRTEPDVHSVVDSMKVDRKGEVRRHVWRLHRAMHQRLVEIEHE